VHGLELDLNPNNQIGSGFSHGMFRRFPNQPVTAVDSLRRLVSLELPLAT